MATRDLSDGRTGVTSARTSRVTRDETKPSFLTTEFYAFVVSVAAILIATVVVPFLPATSNAGPYDGGAYWHRHDDKGW